MVDGSSALQKAMEASKWRGSLGEIKVSGWLTKTRKNSPSALFATKRFFVLKNNFLSWFDTDSGGGRELGKAYVGGATIEHPSQYAFEIAYASGRRDHLRVDRRATPTAKEWVLALRTVALLPARQQNLKRGRYFTVHKYKNKKKAPKEVRVQLVDGVLRSVDPKSTRTKSALHVSHLEKIERSRFVPQQLLLRWSTRRPFTLEFKTIGEAETFYRLLLDAFEAPPPPSPLGSEQDSFQSEETRAVKTPTSSRQSPAPRWLRVRVFTWNLGNRMPTADLGAWLDYRGGRVGDDDLDAIVDDQLEVDNDAIVEALLSDESEDETDEEDDVQGEEEQRPRHAGRTNGRKASTNGGKPPLPPPPLAARNVRMSEEEDDLSDDVVVVGCQECSYSVPSSSSSRQRGKNDREDWVKIVSRQFLPRGYKMHCEEHFWALRLLIFVRQEHTPYTSTVESSRRGTGIGDRLGNKGGIGAALSIYDTTLCFVTAHLQASQAEIQARNANFGQIVESLDLGRKELDILNQFDHVWFFGDLNYRVDVPEKVFFDDPVSSLLATSCSSDDGAESGEASFIRKRELLRTMRDSDQLDAERAAGRAFWGFEEAPHFDFAPTYRFERERKAGRRSYTPNRTPSWCDRILWKSMPGARRVVQTLLTSIDDKPELDTSDHAPVVSSFAVRLPPNAGVGGRDSSESDNTNGGKRNTICWEGEVWAAAGPGLAPFSFRKPQKCALRFFGTYLDGRSTGTDFQASASCLMPRWTDLQPLVVSPGTSLAALRRSTIQIQLLDTQKDQVLGTAMVALHRVCDCKGRPAPFNVFLTYRGVTCGQLSGVLRCHGPLFFEDSQPKPPLHLAYMAAAALTDESDAQNRIVWRHEIEKRKSSGEIAIGGRHTSSSSHGYDSVGEGDPHQQQHQQEGSDLHLPSFSSGLSSSSSMLEQPPLLRELSQPLSPVRLGPDSPLQPHRLTRKIVRR